MESAEKPTTDLQAGVKESLRQMGHTADVNPDPDLSLKNIGDIMEKTTGHTVDSVGTAISGEEPSFPIETVPGKKVISFIREKFKKVA